MRNVATSPGLPHLYRPCKPGIHQAIPKLSRLYFITLLSPLSPAPASSYWGSNCYKILLRSSPGLAWPHWVRCEVWGPANGWTNTCVRCLSCLNSLVSGVRPRTGPNRQRGEQVGTRVTVCWLSLVWLVTTFIPVTAVQHNCSTLNYNSIEPNEDIRYYIAITTKERIFHHNKPPVRSIFIDILYI